MALVKRNTAYSVNAIVNTKFGTKLKCTTAGTTSTDPLMLGGTSPITDGTVIWEVQEEGTGQGLVDYEANKNYSVGDIVIYDDKIYRCTTAHTSTSTFDDSKWEELSGAGIAVWQASTSYSVDDVVIYNDLIWRCITAHTSTSVFDVQKWVLISDGDSVVYSDLAIGTIIPYMGNTPPREFLACDGTVYNITSYTELAEYINEQFGSYDYFGGDGTTTFAVPDLRGEFLRGTGTNSHTNQGSGANVGVHQDGTGHLYINKPSNNALYINGNNGQITLDNADSLFNSAGTINQGRSIFNPTSSDGYESNFSKFTSRPTNTSVLYCIKYTNTTNTIVHSGMKYETLWEGEAGSLSGRGSTTINLSKSVHNYKKLGLSLSSHSSTGYYRNYYEEVNVSDYINLINNGGQNDKLSYGWNSNPDYYFEISSNSSNTQISIDYNHNIITKVIGISEGVVVPTGVQAARVTLWEGEAGNLSGSYSTVLVPLSDSIRKYKKIGIELLSDFGSVYGEYYREFDVPSFIDFINGISITENFIFNTGFGSSTDFMEILNNSTDTQFAILGSKTICKKIVGIKYIQPDSYSTEEKLIGTWIDGKPLYRIVYDSYTITSSTPVSSRVPIYDLTPLNIDKVVSFTTMLHDASDNVFPGSRWENSSSYFEPAFIGGKFTIYQASFSGFTVRAIIEYTKTTD